MFAIAAFAASAPDPVILPASPDKAQAIRAETIPVSEGAELVVFFESLNGNPSADFRSSEIPLFAVLRDHLSVDSASDDRLRQVWIFTYSSPSIAQRMAAAVPFFYHRSGLSSGSARRPPHPIVDLGEPMRGEWRRLALAGAQAEFFDPFGAAARLTTRSYRANLGEYRHTHVTEIVNLINDHVAGAQTALSPWEMQQISGRLSVNRSLFGAFVTDEHLPAAFLNRFTDVSENRGHNWDLLRQAAESNGLYFEPLPLADAPRSFAMVWIAERDSGRPHSFNGQFLGISDPFHDGGIAQWKGYSQIWTLDRDGVRIPDGTPGGDAARMFPLAVYSLDYPGVPLLLVDFRDPGRPQRSEMRRRLANDVATGVLGFTNFGNLGYFAAKSSYMFIQKRHGGTTNRQARRNAFVQLRHALGADGALDPQFRRELMSRVERLNLDPVEKTWSQEREAAWRQYDALMHYAADPRGMARLVETDRWREYRARRAGVVQRFEDRILHRRGTLTPAQTAELKQWREEASSKRAPAGAPANSPEVASERTPGDALRINFGGEGGQ